MPDKNQTTIVTAGDRNFLWGLFLLIASLRMHKVMFPVHVLASGFNDDDSQLLTQFGNILLFPSNNLDKRSMTCQKPEAIFTAQTPYVSWIDGDCIVTGDISQYLVADSLQIRLRLPQENATVYAKHYRPGDKKGDVPKNILSTWQRDVGELDNPSLHRTCVANCFTINRRVLPFIKQWQRQMDQVIPRDMNEVVNEGSAAYFMTDESVLNSVLLFSKLSPEVNEYQLDKNPNAYLIHFGKTPKPWKRWQPSHLKYFDVTVSVLEWVQEQGFETPAIPWTLLRRNKIGCKLDSYTYHHLTRIFIKILNATK